MATSFSVLIHTDDQSAGGTMINSHLLALAIKSRGHAVHFAAPAGSPRHFADQRAAAGIGEHAYPLERTSEIDTSIIDREYSARLFETLRPDVIVFSARQPLSQLAGKQEADRRGVPFVTIFNYVPPADRILANPEFRALSAATINRAAMNIAVSADNRDILRAALGATEDRLTIVHYGRPERFFAPHHAPSREQVRDRLAIGAGETVVLSVGEICLRKGHDLIAAALQSLLLRGPLQGLRFVWLGLRADREFIAKLTARFGRAMASPHLVMPGYGDPLPFLEAADVFLLPSRSEGMPLSLMEAMARGLPVVATAVSGIPEALGGCGILLPDPAKAPRETVAQLIRAIGTLHGDPAARARLGQAAAERARTMFREQRMVDEVEAILARAVRTRA